MKDFFDNLLGILYAIFLMMIPAMAIGLIAFVLNLFGVLDTAIAFYDLFRFGIIILVMFGGIIAFFRGR